MFAYTRFLLFFVLFCFFSVAAIAADISIQSNTDLSSEGNFVLSWQSEQQSVEVQESRDAEFANTRTIYKGMQQSSTLSGKSNGDWFYRIRIDEGPWSTPLKVTVQHHSLSRAFMFLALGLFVFLATLFMIIQGTRNTE